MDKASFIRRMFEDIAFSYDLQNSVLSLRRDISWRKVLARSLRIPYNAMVLDLATGTSEVAVEICRQRPEAKVVGVDISSRMLEIGRTKVRARGLQERIHLGLGDGRLLPFKDASFHAATMVFGLRNIDEREQVLTELCRVLKPGGQVMIMEFGYPDDSLLRALYEFYFNNILPPLGNFLSRTDYAYTYLVDSVRAFPGPDAFLREIGEAGFTDLEVRKLTFGIARMYCGIKSGCRCPERQGRFMKTNWPEKIWVNSPVRLLIQGRETVFFQGLQDMEPGSLCMEIGCGRGAAMSLISRRFHPQRVDAIDIDPEMIRLAKGRKRRVEAHQVDSPKGLIMAADAQRLPYRGNSLDAVFNFGILHHLEDWELGIEEIARVLRQGGKFYFEEIYTPLYANCLLRNFLAHPRENRFQGPQFRAALEDAGLRILHGYRESRFAILG